MPPTMNGLSTSNSASAKLAHTHFFSGVLVIVAEIEIEPILYPERGMNGGYFGEIIIPEKGASMLI